MITIHSIIKNEDRFIKPVLLAIKSFPEIKEILVYDTGSTDRTISEIESIKSLKIQIKIKNKANRQQLVDLRNQQIKATTTPWILLVDGDEIWPKKNLKKLIQAIKSAPKETIALVNRTTLSTRIPRSVSNWFLARPS
jgi:glycosyltransferase involved in cell wall biosynthesis